MQAAAPSVGMALTALGRLDHGAIEQDIARFAQQPNGALAVTVGSAATAQSQRIVEFAARYRLPAIFPFRFTS